MTLFRKIRNRRRRTFLKGVLAQRSWHAYSLAQATYRRSGYVYRFLWNAVNQGWMTATFESPEPRGRRIYVITEAGRAHFKAEIERLAG